MLHRTRHRSRGRSVLFAVALSAAGLRAQSATKPVDFIHPDGTTHYYEVVRAPAGITWTEANAEAARRGGYLGTITAFQESEFVGSLIGDAKLWSQSGTRWDGPWIGGVQAAGAKEPGGGWMWGELEAMSFTAWSPGYPDNKGGADRMHYGGASRSETWADAPSDAKRLGFLVEYSGPTVIRSMGLVKRDPASMDGYTLLAPLGAKDTWLLDPRGRAVNDWTSQYPPGAACYLIPGGRLLRTGGVGNKVFTGGGNGGIVEMYDWRGNLLWSFTHSSDTYCLHHDIEWMPNGNVLMIAWELKTKDEAIAAGRNPARITEDVVWSEKVIEVEPRGHAGGRIVWEWHAWDHVVQDFDVKKANYAKVGDHPERIDLNFTAGAGAADWLHFNAVDYNADLDQIVLSTPMLAEAWIIDHGTTTKQAASHRGGRRGRGGDLLYRWGNPQAWRAGTAADQKLFFQHDTQWIGKGLPGAGNILIFNNGRARPGGEFSSVDEIRPPVDKRGRYLRKPGTAFGPSQATWTYRAPNPTDFFASFICGAQRLKNGNTLIGAGGIGRSFEVTPKGGIVWEYHNPVTPSNLLKQGTKPPPAALMFRSPRYFENGAELRGRKLGGCHAGAGEPIEITEHGLLVDGSSAPQFVRPGDRIELTLLDKAHASADYALATSATEGLLPIDHRFLRMGWDSLLVASLTGQAPGVFADYRGKLDANGRAGARIRLPKCKGLVGLTLFTSFVVPDSASRSGFAFLSNTVRVDVR